MGFRESLPQREKGYWVLVFVLLGLLLMPLVMAAILQDLVFMLLSFALIIFVGKTLDVDELWVKITAGRCRSGI